MRLRFVPCRVLADREECVLVTDPILAHQLVRSDGVTPTRWMFLLHGIFGMGTNFRTMARTLVRERPDWGFVLVDLRGHGASQGLSPPHDLEAAARDLDALERHLGLELSGVAGHSFGGKVAIVWASRRMGALERLVVLDSSPGARRDPPTLESANRVLEVLESMPDRFDRREDFVERLGALGYARGIVEWLTMNVRRDGDRYALRLDLPAIRSMLEDYFARDCWGAMSDPRIAARTDVVVAGRSAVFDEEARARLASSSARNPSLHVTLLEQAGHWVHVDDPEGVLRVFLDALAPT